MTGLRFHNAILPFLSKLSLRQIKQEILVSFPLAEIEVVRSFQYAEGIFVSCDNFTQQLSNRKLRKG